MSKRLKLPQARLLKYGRKEGKDALRAIVSTIRVVLNLNTTLTLQILGKLLELRSNRGKERAIKKPQNT